MILWGNRKLIRQNDKAVRQAQRLTPAAGRKLLGRGVTTLVFEGEHPNSVLKLTVDQVAYELAEAQRSWECAGLPRTGQLFGQVGTTSEGNAIWLFEQERLTKLGVGSAPRKLCMGVSRLVWSQYEHCDTVDEVLASAQPSIPNVGLSAAALHLADFAATRRERLRLDLHASNFMLREASGQAVVSDPFLDTAATHRVQQYVRVKAGLPDNTFFF